MSSLSQDHSFRIRSSSKKGWPLYKWGLLRQSAYSARQARNPGYISALNTRSQFEFSLRIFLSVSFMPLKHGRHESHDGICVWTSKLEASSNILGLGTVFKSAGNPSSD